MLLQLFLPLSQEYQKCHQASALKLVEVLLDGYDLLKYPNESFPASPMMISTTVVPPTPNPAYQTCVDRTVLYLKQLKEHESFPTPPMTISTTVVPLTLNPAYQTCVDRTVLYLKQLKERLHTVSKDADLAFLN
ncbi:hypothetical protein V8G54_018234 [Vigna mungo]|uniref:Uncharacterized protein n=1 Tax=Vigna mungo TaxID=3915 RepID=A0AAQ3NA67_VIGMU